MLIHLRSIDGQPQIIIDPEGEPLPCIETLPWRDSSFRLSWPRTGGGGRDGYSGDPRATTHQRMIRRRSPRPRHPAVASGASPR
jgi:hypothetical protein